MERSKLIVLVAAIFMFVTFVSYAVFLDDKTKWNLPNRIYLHLVSNKTSNESTWNFLSNIFPKERKYVDGNAPNGTSQKISHSNLTVVTAYWNLGTFRKGSHQTFTTNTYLTWTKTFKYLMNPLVIYTDCVQFRDLITKERSEGKLEYQTELVFINRTSLWPFSLLDKIKQVYSQPGYPAHYPNTVNPSYSAAQHAKYAVVADAVRRNLYNTSYFAWLDIGYFRDLIGSNQYFELKIPPNFDSSRLAVNLISHLGMNTRPYSIFRSNVVWVGGGLFIGTRNVVIEFEKLYERAVLYFLDQKLMNSDQQVLYSLYSQEGRKALKPNIELQLYTPTGGVNPWFYLGYLCRKVVNRTKVEEFI